MERKVVIIGCGNVGSTFAYTLYREDLCNILLINHNKCRAYSNVLDILDSEVDCYTHTIFAGDYCDVNINDIVVICAGDSSLLRSSNRLSEFDNSRRIANDIITNLKKIEFKGILINVMNPCDEITNIFRGLDISTNNIIGTGTLLETIRLRRIVYETLGYKTNAIVVGKHGVQNTIVSRDKIPKTILTDVQNRVWKIYEGKGFTNFGISNALLLIIKAILYDSNIEICLSTLNCDVYGFTNTSISVPCIIGNTGIIQIPFYDKVLKALHKIF